MCVVCVRMCMRVCVCVQGVRTNVYTHGILYYSLIVSSSMVDYDLVESYKAIMLVVSMCVC